jgi:hypothetical protein
MAVLEGREGRGSFKNCGGEDFLKGRLKNICRVTPGNCTEIDPQNLCTEHHSLSREHFEFFLPDVNYH